MQKITFILHQIGHYHHARFEYLGKFCELSIIEILPDSTEYAWDTGYKSEFYQSFTKKDQSIETILEGIQPDKVYVCGWSEKIYFDAVKWAKNNKTTVVGISDSRWEDKKRNFVLELIKSFLVKKFDAFLVAGSESEAYLRKLRFKKRIDRPWDIVDNDYFKQGVQKEDSTFYKQHSLPKDYIFINARYIEKKNHLTVINAYAAIKKTIGIDLPVVMIGNGDLKVQLLEQIAHHKLSDVFHVLDFVQYEELPFFYKNAKFLMLPSLSDQWGLVVNEALASGLPVLVTKKCGAYKDLVLEDKNGFGFEPTHDGVMEVLTKIATLSEKDYANLAANTDQVLGNFSLESFKNAVLTNA